MYSTVPLCTDRWILCHCRSVADFRSSASAWVAQVGGRASGREPATQSGSQRWSPRSRSPRPPGPQHPAASRIAGSGTGSRNAPGSGPNPGIARRRRGSAAARAASCAGDRLREGIRRDRRLIAQTVPTATSTCSRTKAAAICHRTVAGIPPAAPPARWARRARPARRFLDAAEFGVFGLAVGVDQHHQTGAGGRYVPHVGGWCCPSRRPFPRRLPCLRRRSRSPGSVDISHCGRSHQPML